MVGRDRGRAHHDLCPVSAEQCDLLRSHLVGHDEDAPVAPAGGHDRKPDPGVPRGSFHDRGSGLEQPLPLGVLDHRYRRAVLYAPAGVELLELCEELARQVPRGPVEPDERGAADQVEKRFGGVYRRTRVGERDHLHPFEAVGCRVDIVCMQLDRKPRLVELHRHIDGTGAEDPYLAREPPAEVGDEICERLVGRDHDNLVGTQRQPFGRGSGPDDHENVHGAMLPRFDAGPGQSGCEQPHKNPCEGLTRDLVISILVIRVLVTVNLVTRVLAILR